MAVPIVEATSTYSDASASTTSYPINKPTGTVSGDLLIAQFSSRGNGGAYTVTPPSGWTSILKVEDGGGQASFCEVFRKVAGSSEPASYTFTLSAAFSSVGIGMIRISGSDNTTPINAFGSQSNVQTTSCTAPSITTTVDDCLLVFLGHVYQESAFSTPASFTEMWDFITGVTTNAVSQEFSYGSKATAGATGTVTSTTNNRQSAGILIAVAPATATPPADATPSTAAVATPTTFTAMDVQVDVTLNLPTLTTPTTIYATGTAPLIENPGSGPVSIDADITVDAIFTGTSFTTLPTIQLDWVFSPPATAEIPRYDITSTPIQRRLSSHFTRTTYADNLYVLTDNTITTTRPTDESTIATIYHGGHVYSLTPEARAILVAAGYMEA